MTSPVNELPEVVDEHRLVVHPVALGTGERLFETIASSRGAVAHVLRPRS